MMALATETHANGPLIAVGFISAPPEAERRAYMRPALAAMQGLLHRFVVGQHSALRVNTNVAAESASTGDLIVLADIRDSGKDKLSAKTLAWFRKAARLFPHARWLAKADTDTFLVWERLQRPLRWLAESPVWGGARLYLGRHMWTSFLDERHSFCGCCGITLKHARTLQTSADAAWGACGDEADRASSSMHAPLRHSRRHNSSVSGPFLFGFGSFFAVSRATARWLRRAPFVRRALRRLRTGGFYSARIHLDRCLARPRAPAAPLAPPPRRRPSARPALMPRAPLRVAACRRAWSSPRIPSWVMCCGAAPT